MGDSYRPNIKNAEMFGEEKKGYSKERVDSYISRLEETYQKATEAISKLKEVADSKDERIDELENAVANLQQNSQLEETVVNLQNENQKLKAELEKKQTAEELAAEKEKDILAKVMIDARVAADKIVSDAEEKAASMKIDSQVQVAKLEERKDKLISEVKTAAKKYQQLVTDIEKGNL